MKDRTDKGRIVVVYGGSGSGKSKVSENISEKLFQQEQKEYLYYIATMMPYGVESEQKIKRHRRQRQGKNFIVKEIYYDLEKKDFKNSVILLDCLSNLVANEWYRYISNIKKEEKKKAKNEISKKIVESLIKIKKQNCDIVVVTNDIFRSVRTHWEGEEDYLSCLGIVNRCLVEQADMVYQIISEQGICLKRRKGYKNLLEGINLLRNATQLSIQIDESSCRVKEEESYNGNNQEKEKIDNNENILIQNQGIQKEENIGCIQENVIEMKNEIQNKKEKILVVGGEFQGKRDWAKKYWSIQKEIHIKDKIGEKSLWNEREQCGYNLYFYIDQWIFLKIEENDFFLSDDIEIEKKLGILCKLFESEFKIEGNSIFLMNEIGCGIVPLEKKDRIYRELSGRFMCQLAEKVDKVYQIVAGCELRLK